MTDKTVSSAVAQRDPVDKIVTWIDAAAADYGRVLPQHIDAAHWVRLAQGLLQRDETLAAAAVQNPTSFKAALLECARLGHEPGTDQYALVPFKEDGRYVVTGIEQYQGEIERMYRAGAVEAVVCEVVHEKDLFTYTPGSRPQHDADWFADEKERGVMVGVYAYAVLKGGATSQVVVMGAAEIARHQEVARTQVMWKKWPRSMWKKTAIHELEKWVPTSAEYQRERLRALAEADALRAAATYTHVEQVDTATGEIGGGE